MTPKYRFINETLSLILDFKLATIPNKSIYRGLMIEILETILSSPYADFGHIVFNKQLENNCSKSINVIKRHIKWLTDNNILLKSNETISNSYINQFSNLRYQKPFQYRLTNDVTGKLDNLRMFVYSSLSKVLNEKMNLRNHNKVDCSLKFDNPNKFKNNNSLRLIRESLNDVSIDLYKALEILYNSKTIINKNDQSKLVYKIALNDNDNISYGNVVNRLYSNITSLSSEVSSCLYINGYKTNEIDARASQITLISLLTRHINSPLHSLVDSEDIDSFYNNLISYIHSNYINSLIVVKSDNNKSYRKTVNSKEYYHAKNDIKPDVYAAIFSGFSNGTTVSSAIKSLYEEPINYLLNKIGNKIKVIKDKTKSSYINGIKFTKLKIQYKSKLAEFLQNLESSIFVTTSVELKKQFDISTFTKHDAIYCKVEQTEYVKQQLINRYKSLGLIHIKPIHISSTNYKPSIFIQPKVNVIYLNISSNSEIQKSIGNTNMTVYKFRNDKLNLEFTGIKSEFIKKYNLDRGSINKLIKGKIKSSKGWKCMKCI